MKTEIGLNHPSNLLTFIEPSGEVIRVNAIFNELPDSDKERMLYDLEAWIVKERELINKLKQ